MKINKLLSTAFLSTVLPVAMLAHSIISDEETESLESVFNTLSGAVIHDLPFIPNIESLTDKESIQEILAEDRVDAIITDEDIEEVVKEIGGNNPFLNPDSSEQEQADYSKQFLATLERKFPEIIPVNRILIAYYTSTQEQNLSTEELNRLSVNAVIMTAKQYVGSEFFKYQAFVDSSKYNTQRATWEYDDTNPTTALFLSSSSEKALRFFEELATSGLDFDVNTAPGEPEHYLAYINAHEMEHVAGRNQKHTKEVSGNVRYFLSQSSGAEKHMNFRNKLDRQLQELDAETGAISALRNIVPHDVLEYISSMKIAQYSMYKTFGFLRYAGKRRATAENAQLISDNSFNEKFLISGPHDIGFHTMAFLKTGKIADYASLQPSVNGFYLKTVEYYLSQVEKQLEKPEDIREFREKYESMNTPSSEEVLGIAIQALEDGIYTPNQTYVAHILIHSLSDVLGAKIVPMDKTIENAVNHFSNPDKLSMNNITQPAHNLKQHMGVLQNHVPLYHT